MQFIVEFLIGYAKTCPQKLAFTFIDDKDDASSITYLELHTAAQSIATHLLKNLIPGETVVLLLPQGLEYIQAFLGCLYAGVVAVPLYPPKNAKHSGRVLKVIEDCNAKLAITNSDMNAFLTEVLAPLPVHDFSSCVAEKPGNREFKCSPDSLAFLQYTSGSTGMPKGVMVNHANIIANLKSLEEATHCSSEDIFCNWLPLFHDLGLVNTLLLPIYLGAHSVLMSPASFIRRPLNWLEAISHYRATICGAPNFAFDHCSARIKPEQIVNIDLSSWRIAFNAAEPINPESLTNFYNILAPAGFKQTALYPSYGMAEATVFIAGAVPGNYVTQAFSTEQLQLGHAVTSNNGKTTRLVASGKIQSHHALRIVNPDSLTPVKDGEIGEIWFSGPSVAQGYWNDEQKTASTFHAYLSDDANTYLRTGDLGFIHDGNLFIAGRIKDVLIIKGRNYYPQDIEKIAYESVAGLQRGGAAAFEVNGAALLIVEVEPRAVKTFSIEHAIKKIRGNVFEYFDVLLDDIIFVRAGSLPKTSSGKIQRAQSKQQFQAEQFELLGSLTLLSRQSDYQPPITETEIYLAQLWEELLQQPVGRSDNFFQLGGQSLSAARIISNINQSYSLNLSVNILFSQDNLSLLAAYIDEQSKKPAVDVIKIPKAKNRLTVSDSQRSLWFIDQFDGASPQYNISSLIKITGSLQRDVLCAAINSLVERHAILRTCYEQQGGELFAALLESWKIDLPIITVSRETLPECLQDYITRPFDLTSDVMIRACVFALPADEYQLLLCFHHIAVDGFSLGIIERELSHFYCQHLLTNAVSLPEQELQFGDYAAFSQGDASLARAYWQTQLNNLPQIHGFPLDYIRPQKQDLSGHCIFTTLDAELTRGLKNLARQEKLTFYTVLQTAFTCLLHRYSGQADIVMGSPYANRDLADTADMVGYFVNPLVLRNQVAGGNSFSAQLHNNYDVIQAAITHNQLSFIELIALLNPERSLSHHPIFQIMFTFNEAQAESFTLKDATTSRLHTPRYFSRFDLTLEITERNNSLELAWEYATPLLTENTIRKLHEHFEQLLRSVIANPLTRVSELQILPQPEQDHLVRIGLNNTHGMSQEQSIQQCFERQVMRSEHSIAVYYGQQSFTYGELNKRANQLAHFLLAQNVKPGDLVALCIERGLNTIVSLLAILKAGAAYVPLDPGYPLERLDYMLDNAAPIALLCQQETQSMLSIPENCRVINLDIENYTSYSTENIVINNFSSSALAYVIYTSGSTGLPKGVKVQHRNVLNFFLGLDEHFVNDCGNKHWLAVTSICFDISVLELFWTLCCGDKITLQPERPQRQLVDKVKTTRFGLFYFASNSDAQADKFSLVLKGAKFADQHGLDSIWLPERHFNAFGGQFANPAVAAAAVAVITENIRIQSGSVVLPLHDPIRVAEEWSMVDNLSNGRVGLSIAPGWQPNDFVLGPESYQQRHAVMKEKLQVLKQLWQGDSIARENGLGQVCNIAIYPKPVQKNVPVSITAAGNIDAFIYAGSIGANILTHLLGQTLTDLSEKISAYRLSLAEHGFDPEHGKVTLMLHTFMHDDENFVKQQVELPFKQYLLDSVALIQPVADQFNLNLVTDQQLIIEHAFNRYFNTAGLFGTPAQCVQKILGIQQAGVDDIACLIDFGIANETVLESLPYIVELQKRVAKISAQQTLLAKRFQNIWQPDQLISECDITHFQCTPSLARELSSASLQKLKTLLVGGEALPEDIANSLSSYRNLSLFNMYGPTETTVWVSIKQHCSGDKVVLAGPMANTQFLILDENKQLVPQGVPGDLYIAGVNVSAGYLHNAELTAERFTKNAFAPNDNFAELYKTGDLVKWVKDSQDTPVLQYLGRSDLQVKMNGFRIELGEIENQLNKSPYVHQSVVINRQNRLHAYVVGEEEFLPDIKQTISRYLPDYMLPSYYKFMADFPLTPNGKVDRNALPDINLNNKTVRSPTNETEMAIHKIWLNNLLLDNIGIEDDFFGAGGNSLMAIKVISEINARFDDVELTVKELFSTPSIAQLSQIVEAKRLVKTSLSEYNKKDLEEVVW